MGLLELWEFSCVYRCIHFKKVIVERFDTVVALFPVIICKNKKNILLITFFLKQVSQVILPFVKLPNRRHRASFVISVYRI